MARDSRSATELDTISSANGEHPHGGAASAADTVATASPCGGHSRVRLENAGETRYSERTSAAKLWGYFTFGMRSVPRTLISRENNFRVMNRPLR